MQSQKALALLLVLFSATVAIASITGTISGIVTDPGGAVVAGAEVTATNVKTWVVYPDNSFQEVLDLNSQAAPNNILLPGSADSCPGNSYCQGFSTSYLVKASDIGSGVSFSTHWPPSLGTTTITASGQGNTVLFQYAGAASMVGNSTAKGTAGQSE